MAALSANASTREIVQSIKEIAEGNIASVGAFTCSTGATSTLVSNALMRKTDIVIVGTGDTANAAAERGGTAFYVTRPSTATGQFKVNHANNGQTDRTFGYFVIRGPES